MRARRAAVNREALDAAAKLGEVVVRFEVGDALPDGRTSCEAKFSRYPMDPTVLFILNDRTAGASPR